MNLPNKITVARVVLVFVVLAMANSYDKFLLSDGSLSHVGHAIQLACVIITIIAGLTDLLDGYIARKYNMVSDFGKLMDPLADKIFVTTIFLVFVDKVVFDPITHHPQSMLPGWVVVVVLSREFLVTGLRSLAASKGEIISADVFGKAKTASQMAFFAFGGFIWMEWLPLVGTAKIFWIAAMWLVALITVFSGLTYFIKYKHLYLTDISQPAKT